MTFRLTMQILGLASPFVLVAFGYCRARTSLGKYNPALLFTAWLTLPATMCYCLPFAMPEAIQVDEQVRAVGVITAFVLYLAALTTLAFLDYKRRKINRTQHAIQKVRPEFESRGVDCRRVVRVETQELAAIVMQPGDKPPIQFRARRVIAEREVD